MSGFLHRVLTRHDATLAPLRRRRPSLFEARETAPTHMPEALPGVVPAPRGQTQGVHTREIHHHDAAPAPSPPPLRTERLHTVSERVVPLPQAPSPAPSLPTPPTLRAPAREALASPTRAIARNIAPDASSATQAPRRERGVPHGTAAPASRDVAREDIEAAAPPRARSAPDAPAAPRQASALPLPPRLPQAQRATAPVAHPARRASLPAPAETPVQVSIGSVEIRAQAPASPAPTPRTRAAAASAPRPSLDAYLRERHGGPR